MAIITSNTSLATMPGNVFLPAIASGLPRDSVVNVTALATLNKFDLGDGGMRVPESILAEIDHGLSVALNLR